MAKRRYGRVSSTKIIPAAEESSTTSTHTYAPIWPKSKKKSFGEYNRK